MFDSGLEKFNLQMTNFSKEWYNSLKPSLKGFVKPSPIKYVITGAWGGGGGAKINENKSILKANDNIEVSSAELKHDPRETPNGIGKDKASNTKRYAVSFKIYRVRKLDPDNTLVKWHVDSLRYAGIIPNDTEESISLKIEQIKVKSYKDQKTVIEIEPMA